MQEVFAEHTSKFDIFVVPSRKSAAGRKPEDHVTLP